jgi:hypothetical protein
MALLVCALVAAQAVTLGLTVLFPPRPQARWSLDEVVQGLSGSGLSARLERAQLSGPPDIGGAGWLVAPATRDALAARLHRQSKDVMLAFYTQLPVGGIAVPAGRPGVAAQADRRALQAWPVDWMVGTAHAQGAPPNGGFPGGGFPGEHPAACRAAVAFRAVACLAVCPEAAGVACRGPRACGRIAQYAGQSHRGRRSITRIGHRRRRHAPTHCGRGSAARLAQRHARRFADPGAGAGRAVWRRGWPACPQGRWGSQSCPGCRSHIRGAAGVAATAQRRHRFRSRTAGRIGCGASAGGGCGRCSTAHSLPHRSAGRLAGNGHAAVHRG